MTNKFEVGMNLLQESVIYLFAAIIMVAISRRLGFGSVLGYLVAGILIGPFGLRFVHDPEHILHFAELGVVFLLFIVGLELRPSRLWVLRKMVFGLGSAQVLLSAAVIGLLAIAFGQSMQTAIVVGLVLALSSTAFVLQMLAEKRQLTTSHGRAAFSILLFQDLAAIPLIAILPMLGPTVTGAGLGLGQAGLMAIAIVGLIVGGRFLVQPVLQVAAGSKIPEIFTATALLIVIGAALLMQLSGMSMVLGAFIAGMLLADSEYRHQLEADIAPFKGLLLGLFFIAVGMTVNIDLLLQSPLRIAIIVSGLMLAKAIVLLPLARTFGLCGGRSAMSLAAIMSQGGEFAFVLFAIAARENVLPKALTDELILAVAVSMLLTPLIYIVNEFIGRKMEASIDPEYDAVEPEHNEIIIAGFGRVGQIVARLLRAKGKTFTALEIDSTQVNVVRRYGNIVHYGDASRLDILRAAGADHAKIFVLAIDDIEGSVRTAEAVTRNYPHLKIVARARNRRHAHSLMDLGITHIFRETLFSSIAMSARVLKSLGIDEDEVERLTMSFRERDTRLLFEQHAFRHSEEKLIQSSKDTAAELESLFRGDVKH
ncbi:MAG: monovalent cation:proton antiporter-2 (CPA2) family protein [Woeseiaceae bacterium]